MMNFQIIKPDSGDCGCSGVKNISFNLVNPGCSSGSSSSGPARWDQIIGRPSCLDSCDTVLQHIKDNLGLGDLNNVSITSPANNHGLYYNSSSNTWENKSILSTLPLSATAPIQYNSGTGVISSLVSNTSQDGYLTSVDWNIFNNKQPAGNYITSLTGEATASGPGAAAVTLSNAAVIGKVLTGLNITGGSVVATDTILQAFGKVQNQISALLGGVTFQSVWNASTNSPSLASSTGTKGHYYVVNVAGSTNLDGITDWKVGDWAIYDGTAWQKVDNTDAVSSVNGFVGAVSLTTFDVTEVTNLYYTDARARAAVSLTTTGSSGAATYNPTTGVFNIPDYGGALSGYVPYTGATGSVTLGAYDLTATNLVASSKVNIGSPSGTTGDLNTGQGGFYSYRSAGRYVRFNTSGTFNDFLSLGAKLVMNYGFSGTVENISMFEGSAAGDGQFIVGSPTATNARFLLKGKDTGTTNFISRWFDSGNTEKFSVRNDGQTTVASLSAGGIVKSTAGVLGLATAGTDYLAPSALSGYLPLTGGTLTGNLIITGTRRLELRGTAGTSAHTVRWANSSGTGFWDLGTYSGNPESHQYFGLTDVVNNEMPFSVNTKGNMDLRSLIDGTSTEYAALKVAVNINQSGAGSYNVIYGTAYLAASGSGDKYLLNLGTNNSSVLNGGGGGSIAMHTPKFTVDINGSLVGTAGTFSGNVVIGSTAAGNTGSTLGALRITKDQTGLGGVVLIDGDVGPIGGGSGAWGVYLGNEFIATGNNQTFYGLRVESTMTVGAYTGCTYYAANFSGITSITGSYLYFPTSFSGTEVAGSIYKRASDGLVLFGAAGSTNDFTLYNSAGSTVLTVPTGTVTAKFSGDVGIVKSSPVYYLQNSTSITTGSRGDLAWYNSSVSTVALIRASAYTDNTTTALEFWTRGSGSLTKAFELGSNLAATFYGTGSFTGNVVSGGYVVTGFDGTYGPTYTGISFQGSAGGGLNGENRIFASRNGSDGLYICSATSRSILFRPGGSSGDVYTIEASGNNIWTGEGTFTSARLNLTGTDGGGKILRFNGGTTTYNAIIALQENYGSTLEITGSSVGGGSTYTRNIARFNFTDLSSTFAGSGSFGGDITLANSKALLWSTTEGITGDASTHVISIATNNTEIGRFTSAGYFKVSNNGTYVNSTGSYHEIYSNLDSTQALTITNSGASNPYGVYIQHTTSTNNGSNYFIYAAEGSSVHRFSVTTDGGIDNYSANNTNLSDETTKREIVEMDSQWDIIKNFPYRKFKYNDQTHDYWNYGTGARALHKIAPHLVDTDSKDGKWRVYDTDIFYTQGKALQEALIRIEHQALQIKELQAIILNN